MNKSLTKLSIGHFLLRSVLVWLRHFTPKLHYTKNSHYSGVKFSGDISMDLIRIFKVHPETLKAALILILALGLLNVYNFSKEPIAYSIFHYILSAVSLFVYVFFSIYCIYSMRGLEKTSRKPPYAKSSIGIWGICWRAFILNTLSVIGAGLVLLPINGSFEIDSLSWWAVLFIATLVITPIFCWLIFSKDRKGQLTWCFSIFRGY